MAKKIASLYAEIGADSSKLESALTDSKGKLAGFGGQLNNTVKSVTGFSLTTIGAAGVVAKIGGEIKKSITDWSVYAENIGKAAANAGVSTEEMSRLVQAADDFRVSQESLESAMVMALKNGFTPTIENIAKLSDEYLAIEDPAERAQMATKIFGRQYADIAPLLQRGSEAILAGTAAINDNLIVTEEATQKNKEYMLALDEFQDSWRGYSNAIAQDVLPSLTAFIDILNSPDSNSAANFINTVFSGTFIESETSKMIRSASGYNASIKDMSETLRDADKASRELADGTNVLADATNNANEAMKSYNEQLLFKIASEGLGEEEALALAYTMGVVDTATVTATEKTKEYKRMLDDGKISIATYNALINGMADAIARLQDKEVTVTVNTYENTYKNTYTGGGVGGSTTVRMQASGGPVIGGEPYIVGEVGPELFVPQQSGKIISNNDLRQLLGEINGGVTVYLNATVDNEVDVESMAYRVAEVINRRR